MIIYLIYKFKKNKCKMKTKNFVLSKIAITFLLFGNCALLNAQVTVGANVVPSATLDVVASEGTPAGIIAPRLKLTDLQALHSPIDIYGEKQNGAIVYITDATGSPKDKTVNITDVGYYYYDAEASVWKGFGNSDCVPKTNVIPGNLSGRIFYASEFFARQTVLVHYGTGFLSNLTLPDLNSTIDVGKTVIITNRGTSGTIQAYLTLIGNSDGLPYSATLPMALALHRSRGFMWIGYAWVEATS